MIGKGNYILVGNFTRKKSDYLILLWEFMGVYLRIHLRHKNVILEREKVYQKWYKPMVRNYHLEKHNCCVV